MSNSVVDKDFQRLKIQNKYFFNELKTLYMNRGKALIKYFDSTGIYDFEQQLDEETLVERALNPLFVGNGQESRRIIKLILKLDESKLLRSKYVRVPLRKSLSALIRARRLYKKLRKQS